MSEITGQDEARRARLVVQREALKRWRKREMRFPTFTRRMTPDNIDYISGSWDRIVAETLSSIPVPADLNEGGGK